LIIILKTFCFVNRVFQFFVFICLRLFFWDWWHEPLPMSRTQQGKFQLLRFNLAVAVKKQERVIPTAVFWTLTVQTQKGLFLLPFSSTFRL